MAIYAENSGVKRELIPAGNYIATCYSMICLGTAEEEIQGKKVMQNKVKIGFELPTEMKVFNPEKGEQPLTISIDYTLSMNEKSNLRKQLESWRGKNFTEEEAKKFDITKLLGICGMINVIHKTSKSGNVYSLISNISGIPKGMQKPTQINPTFEFNFDDKFDNEVLETMPEFIKNRIKISDEYKKLNNNTTLKHDLPDFPADEQEDDGLPF